MKRICLIFLMTASFAVVSSAQNLGPVDPEVKKQIGASLTACYGLKDALVDSNVEVASVKAAEYHRSLEGVDVSKMSGPQKTEWEKLGPRLRTDASHINKNKELGHQREHFMKLSNNMYALVFGFQANETEAYLQYCPMKKASWLSTSKDIKNPYYGSKMLKCGSVKATLKKGAN